MNPPRLLPTARVYVFEGSDVWERLAAWLKGFEVQPSILAFAFQEDEDGPQLIVAVEEVK